MNEFCPTCNGSGGIDVLEYSIGEVVTITCPDCRGSGESADVSRIRLAERAKHYEQTLEHMQREIHKAAYEQAERYKKSVRAYSKRNSQSNLYTEKTKMEFRF